MIFSAYQQYDIRTLREAFRRLLQQVLRAGKPGKIALSE